MSLLEGKEKLKILIFQQNRICQTKILFSQEEQSNYKLEALEELNSLIKSNIKINYIENIDHLQDPSLNIKIKSFKPLAPNAAKYSEFYVRVQ